MLCIVNNDTISASEFAGSYYLEKHLIKSENEPKKQYLHAMINEKIFSQQGYKKNLYETTAIQQKIHRMQKVIVYDQYLTEKILPQINYTLSKDEVNGLKSRLIVKFRFWIEKNLKRCKRSKNPKRKGGTFNHYR